MERDPVERHIMNYIRKAFSRVDGFDSKMPLDEFRQMVHWVGDQYCQYWPYLSYPRTQVDHPWNQETFEKLKERCWSKHVEKLALKHLTPEDYLAWKGKKSSG